MAPALLALVHRLLSFGERVHGEQQGNVNLEAPVANRTWHEITKEEVLDYSPSLADKVALSTATYTVEEIAQEIAEVVHGPGTAPEAA